MKVQFIKDENYQTMYIDGKQSISGHTLYPEDVARAILGGENVYEVDLEIDFEDGELTVKDNGDILDGDITLWTNGGHPQEFPYNYKD